MTGHPELPYAKAANRIARLARLRGVGIAFETVDESPVFGARHEHGQTLAELIVADEKRMVLEAVEELLQLDDVEARTHPEHPPRLLTLHTAAAGRALALLADDLDAVGQAESASGWRYLAERLLTGTRPNPKEVS